MRHLWEFTFSYQNIPHRDFVEFLAFTMGDSFDISTFKDYLEFHTSLWNRDTTDIAWMQGYVYALKEFLVCRMCFYKAAEIVMKLKFPNRIINTCFKMINFIEQEYKL